MSQRARIQIEGHLRAARVPVGAGEGHVRGPRRLAAAQDALHPVAPMETPANPGNETEATRSGRGTGTAVRFLRPRPLVECGASHMNVYVAETDWGRRVQKFKPVK